MERLQWRFIRFFIQAAVISAAANFFVSIYWEEIHLKNQAVDIYGALSRELKLVLICSGITIEEYDRQAVNQLLAEPIDWDIFLGLAKRHEVYPLVYQALTTIANSVVPDMVMTVLRGKLLENTSKTLQMTGELVNLLRVMEENGIRVVVLKGFPLGYMLYGDLKLRPSVDLDILLRPEDVDKATKVLENQGYIRTIPCPVVTPGRLRNWMKTNHHFEYWHRDRDIYLELHWRLGHYGIEIPLNIIENRLTKQTIAGQTVSIMETEELLLFLALHGASHAWFRLKWLCDVGVILRQGRFSWKRLYALSEHLGFEVLLDQTLILARYLLQAPVPDNIIKRITKDRKALSLALMALPFISSVNYVPANLKIGMPLYFHSKKYEFSVQLGWRKKSTFLYNILLPKEKDFELIALPESLYFLYYLLRPFSWFCRKVMELVGSK